MRRGAFRRAAELLVVVLATAACDLSVLQETPPPADSSAPSSPSGQSPSPAESTSAAPSTSPGGSIEPGQSAGALPTPDHYLVARGDTLIRIARMFGITVPQLLAANPQVQDPNSIRAGTTLTIPPRDSLAVAYRGGGGVVDPTGDVADLLGNLTQAPGYADLARFTTRFEGADIVVEIDGISPPPPLDPTGEELRYIVEIDVTGDLEPDLQVTASNALVQGTGPDAPAFGLSVLDRRTNLTTTGPNVKGSVANTNQRLVIRLARVGLGQPSQVATVALVERDFYPDGREVPDTVESTVDRVPDQQWPRANPRWLIVVRGA
jgi:LysM repeat protein